MKIIQLPHFYLRMGFCPHKNGFTGKKSTIYWEKISFFIYKIKNFQFPLKVMEMERKRLISLFSEKFQKI